MNLMMPLDRQMAVPPGQRVVTSYVEIDKVRMGCRDRMAVGDVEAAYRRQLTLGESQAWPCPIGRWEGGNFIVHDGRHAYIAALMIGHTHLLVAWLEEEHEAV